MRVVIALGGNALLKRGEPLEAELQRHNVRLAARSIAEIAEQHDVALTHGNGPQVGLLALQAAAYKEVAPYPLDVLGAESAGMIGYILEQELHNRLPERRIATVLTQVLVDHNDPAFANPTKFVGPVYSEQPARLLSAERGWSMARDGEHFRRVVPSPLPQRILEVDSIRLLMEAGVLVISVGGGGIPVVQENGMLRGVEAVIDKDRASALLAAELEADSLLMLTDVPAVYVDWGTPRAKAIRRASPAQLRSFDFVAGSMGPKVEAACQFVERSGRWAAIGAQDHTAAILRGEAGTVIDPQADSIEWFPS